MSNVWNDRCRSVRFPKEGLMQDTSAADGLAPKRIFGLICTDDSVVESRLFIPWSLIRPPVGEIMVYTADEN